MTGQRIRLPWFDSLLIAAIIALLGVVAYWVLSSPPLWAWCLNTLDARGWTHWTWTGVVVALVAALAVIRLWPEKTCAKPANEPAALTPCPSPRGRGE